ncbi:MAG: WbuC family cupin fold metalloprotein [Dysgonamonadaceae bacterium]|nr:WbuC family cupin fold metalloprotein [Dysgonamonadaceae bacterium]
MKLITGKLLDETSLRAKNSPRLRMNYNIHDDLNDPVNRLLNAMEPGTYIRPHRHSTPPKNESTVLLRGSLEVLIFDDRGHITHRELLSSATGLYAVDIPPGTWHGLVVKEAGTVVYEIKTGPYCPIAEADWAPWSPPPGDASAVAGYLEMIGR